MSISRRKFVQIAGTLGTSGLAISQRATAQSGPGSFVLVVELEIFPSEIENFKKAISENGQTAVREEPGCRQFNIAFQRTDPNRVMLFEVYDNAEAFAAHQASAHFKKYAAATSSMVKSRKRIEMSPVGLFSKL
jgi:autoinducer 2-degrading protein